MSLEAQLLGNFNSRFVCDQYVAIDIIMLLRRRASLNSIHLYNKLDE